MIDETEGKMQATLDLTMKAEMADWSGEIAGNDSGPSAYDKVPFFLDHV